MTVNFPRSLAIQSKFPDLYHKNDHEMSSEIRKHTKVKPWLLYNNAPARLLNFWGRSKVESPLIFWAVVEPFQTE